MPKAELHVHLDGSLRPDTLVDLARERGVPLPRANASALERYMVVPAGETLESYLERFDVTLSVMQDAEALERIAFELAVDCAAETVWYVEARFCPLLNTREGLDAVEAVEAALDGLGRAEETTGIRTGLILCALRSLPPERSVEVAELARAFHGRGVCGFDIAGAEAGHPVRDHADAFDLAAGAGVPITIHAGEGYGPPSIREALDIGHALRIGHGTRLQEDPDLEAEVARRGVPLEACLTANVQTGTVDRLEDHPLARYHRAGVPVTLSTDNRLMSGVTLTDEYVQAAGPLGLEWGELVAVARAGFEHAFLPRAERVRLLTRFDETVQTL